jgi:hypothetical protein
MQGQVVMSRSPSMDSSFSVPSKRAWWLSSTANRAISGRESIRQVRTELGLILAETLRDACGLPMALPLRTVLSNSAGFLRPNTRSRAFFRNSDLVTPSRRDSCPGGFPMSDLISRSGPFRRS